MDISLADVKPPGLHTKRNLKDVCLFLFSPKGVMSSAKSAAHERKSAMTPTQRDSVPAKSPVSGVDPGASHSPFDPHHRPVVPGEVYRPHLPPHLDPTLAFHRAVLDPGTTFTSFHTQHNNNECIYDSNSLALHFQDLDVSSSDPYL